MTAADFKVVDESLAAERSGDAARALELHTSVPALNLRSRHHVLLGQLASLGQQFPEWVWARWIAYQAVRCEDSTTASGRMQRQVLKYVVETFHGDQLADCHANGGDLIKVVSWVASESWIFQQLVLHEFEGLTRFIDEHVSGVLGEHEDLARSWQSSRLRGYRVGEGQTRGRLSVLDASGESSVDVLDLGARATAGDEGWVLGRLVPSGVDDLMMFDTAPIAVPERVAHEVSTSDEPWQRVKDALDEGRLVERSFMRTDLELVTDVPSIDLLRVGTAPEDLDRVTAQLRSGRDEIPRAAFGILRRALDGTLPESDAPHLAAAVLQPAARDDARRLLVREGQYDIWARWAAMVHEPARGLLLDFGEAARAVG